MSENRKLRLLETLVEFALGRTSLDAFEDEFLAREWELARTASPDPNLLELTGEVLLWLTEASLGHRTEQELRNLVAKRLSLLRLGVSPPLTTASSTENIPVMRAAVTLSGMQGTPPVAASA